PDIEVEYTTPLPADTALKPSGPPSLDSHAFDPPDPRPQIVPAAVSGPKIRLPSTAVEPTIPPTTGVPTPVNAVHTGSRVSRASATARRRRAPAEPCTSSSASRLSPRRAPPRCRAHARSDRSPHRTPPRSR